MHRNINNFIKFLLLSGSVLMAGCMGSNPVGVVTPDSDTLGQLAAMNWQLQSIKNATAAPVNQLQSGIAVNRYQLGFSGNKMNLKGGCNLASGAVKLPAAGKMSVGTMMMTNRGCGQALMQADAEITNALAQVSHYRLNGQQLSLLGSRSILQFKGSPTVEANYGGKGVRKFIDVRNTAQGLQWREATYNSDWVRTNKNAPWVKAAFPGIQGFTPTPNTEYTVRIKEFRDGSGRTVWVKDRITRQGVLSR